MQLQRLENKYQLVAEILIWYDHSKQLVFYVCEFAIMQGDVVFYDKTPAYLRWQKHICIMAHNHDREREATCTMYYSQSSSYNIQTHGYVPVMSHLILFLRIQ